MSRIITSEEELSTDVVVVGGGGAGMAAAISAREGGAKTVLLEKRGKLGGTGVMATGIFAAESPVQKRMMIDAPRDLFFREAMDYAHWTINPLIVRAFVDKSGETIQWLEGKGVEFDWIQPLYPNQVPPVQHCPKGRGAGLMKALARNCRESGVQLLTDATAKRILVNEKEGVTGVQAEIKEKKVIVHARSVIIATGGYGGNKELLKKYCPSYSDDLKCIGLPNTGDGILMATEIGAATEGLGLLLWLGPAALSPILRTIIMEPSLILVNKKGERFTDENLSCHFERGNPLSRQPDKICYALFDSKIKQNITSDGLKRPGWGLPRHKEHLLPQIEIADLEKELKLQADKGIVRISDSWLEIAKWLGISPKILESQINEYNSFCDKGHDDIFVKDPRYLIALRTPPYYAINCFLGYLNTLGGIRINHHMEVLNHNDKPIPGLYAAGVDTGGWESGSYGGAKLPGSALGFAVNSGRIAGENAAEYIS